MDDTGNHVPLIVKWKGKSPQGKVLQDIVDFSDMLPTLCEAAGVEIPKDIDGVSFLPQIKGEKGTPRESIYMWYSRSGKGGYREFARNQRYKLYGTGKFFDIKNDPNEKSPVTDLTDDQKAVKKMLQAKLDDFKDARPAHLKMTGKKPKKKKKTKKK